ncbi:MAG: hypothetical protein QOJ58_4585, partial [Alphaproteobacteria bacterium]|nr:hypothetical protein [Alphaproteobacteria bacterium]
RQLCANADIISFDHFVGTAEQCGWHVYAQHLGGLRLITNS